MLSPKKIEPFIEGMLASGETRRDVILDALVRKFGGEVECEYAVRSLCRQRLSLVVGKWTDASGDRVAFPSRDAEGQNVIVHLGYTNDRATVLAASDRYDREAKEKAHISARLYEVAMQMELFADMDRAA
jgi:hypothetical protein